MENLERTMIDVENDRLKKTLDDVCIYMLQVADRVCNLHALLAMELRNKVKNLKLEIES